MLWEPLMCSETKGREYALSSIIWKAPSMRFQSRNKVEYKGTNPSELLIPGMY